MLVLYAAVVLKSPTDLPCVLAERATVPGNFQKVAVSLIHKMHISNNRHTVVLHRYAFHMIVKERIVFLALVDKALKCPKTMPFSFLEALCDAFFALKAQDSRISNQSIGEHIVQ